MVNKLFLLVVAILCGICSGREEQTIDISPKCAAVLVTAGAAGGGAVAYALAPAALCQAGFCSAGVTSSSFASWWQSTLPLVQSGSLFGTLQSIAMGGVSTKMIVTGSVLGGQMSTMYLQQLCGYVDNPDSKMASVFDANLEAFRGVNKAADKVKAACSSSNTCTAATDLVQSASETLSSGMTSVWDYVTSYTKSEEVLNLEKDIARLEEQIKELNEHNWGLKLLESFRAEGVANPGFQGYLEWLDHEGMQDQYVSTLKKELDNKNARLRFIQMDS